MCVPAAQSTACLSSIHSLSPPNGVALFLVRSLMASVLGQGVTNEEGEGDTGLHVATAAEQRIWYWQRDRGQSPRQVLQG